MIARSHDDRVTLGIRMAAVLDEQLRESSEDDKSYRREPNGLNSQHVHRRAEGNLRQCAAEVLRGEVDSSTNEVYRRKALGAGRRCTRGEGPSD